MGVEDLLKMKPRELQILIATKVEQVCDKDLPEIKRQLAAGEVRFDDHEGRIRDIETEKKVKMSYGLNGIGSRKKIALVVGGGGSLLTTIAFLVLSAGRVLGWW